jgi:uncharacterized protein YbaA (DUF1428 family)
MSRYIDGFVVPIPKARMEDYKKLARTAAAVWKEYGALEYVEAVADDVQVGELTSFPRSVQLKEDETVVFAYVVYESREARDRINAQVMADPRIAGTDPASMPFDGKRMIWGGFSAMIDLKEPATL